MRPCKYYYKCNTNADMENDSYICTICQHKLKGAGNISRHVKKHIQDAAFPKKEMGKSPFFHKTPTEQKPIDQNTVDILNFKVKSGISFKMISDPTFKKVAAHPEAIACRQTMSIYQKEIGQQMLEQSYAQLHDKIISIALDGGTVIHSKWIAVVGFCHNEGKIGLKLLDIILMNESCTTENIIQKIKNLNQTLSTKNAKIVAACSDNGSNFEGCFNNSIKNSSLFIREIIRVSCACHTGQLAIVDLCKVDEDVKNVIDSLNEFSSLRYKATAKIKAAGLTGYPPIQNQRWNSYHTMLVYINSNFDKLAKLFPNSYIFQNISLVEEIEEAIKPIHDFTNNLEGDGKDQSDVYVEMRHLISKLEELKKTNAKAGKLLKQLRQRCKDTIDYKLSETIYYFSSAGLNEFPDQYPHIDDTEDDEEIPSETISRIKKIKEIQKKVVFLCNAWNINDTSVLKVFRLLTRQHNLFEEKFITFEELIKILPDITDKDTKNFMQFINYLRIIPASEASAERIFAEMRDLYSDREKSMKPETLRSALIMNFINTREKYL